jgi:hypothetical protein
VLGILPVGLVLLLRNDHMEIYPFAGRGGGTEVPRGVNPALRFHGSGRMLRKHPTEEGGGLVSDLVGGGYGGRNLLFRRVNGSNEAGLKPVVYQFVAHEPCAKAPCRM